MVTKGVLMNYRIIMLVIVLYHAQPMQATTIGKAFFSPRSQGSNMARWLAGQTQHIYRADTTCTNGSLVVIPEYSQTIFAKELGKFLFLMARIP